MSILNFIEKLYENSYFTTSLLAATVVLIVLFFIVLILGIRDAKKKFFLNKCHWSNCRQLGKNPEGFCIVTDCRFSWGFFLKNKQ